MELVETAKKVAELGRQKSEAESKLWKAKWDFKNKSRFLDAAIRDGRETGLQRRNLEAAAREVEKRAKEIEQIDRELSRLKY